MFRTWVFLAALPLLLAVAAVPMSDRSGGTAPADVQKVHLLFSHHLDVGLNEGLEQTEFCKGFATKIIQEYFDRFIPRAIRLAEEMRGGKDSFAYTIHPWIASLYVDCVPWSIHDGCRFNPGQLKCPSADQVSKFDAAVRRGDLLWADSPFNIDAGIVGEPSMYEGMVDIAGSLNERYNLSKKERVWSNVDVPGFARSTIPLLVKAGVTALSVCANVGGGGTGLGTVPQEMVGNANATMFRWRDPVSEAEILVLYHQAQHDSLWDIPIASTLDTYGGFTRPDNMIILKSGVALASFIGSDNTGPPLSTFEVKRIYNKVRSVFPNAKVFGSTWDAFVAEIPPAEIAALPVHSSEWGDKWLTGMATDPVRLATYRALMRARASCLESGACHMKDPVMRNFTRFAAKIPEHTQGVDRGGNFGCVYQDILHTPCPLKGTVFNNEEFARAHTPKKNLFPGADDSWLEARFFNTLAIQAVPAAHPLAQPLQAELAALEPHPPAAPAPWTGKAAPAVTCRGKLHTASLNFSQSGSIQSLSFGAGAGEWSRLMDLRYSTFSDNAKGNPDAIWSPTLLGFWSDANVAGSESAETCRVTLELGFNSSLHSYYGAPETVLVTYELNPDGKSLSATLTWQNKTNTLWPEALTVFSRPMARAGHRWSMDSLGEWVGFTNVTKGGERYMHAAWSGIQYSSSEPNTPGLRISTLDAGMVCPVLNAGWDSNLTSETALQQSCFGYGNHRANPDLLPLNDATIDGVGINLHNNKMGISGFAMWYPFGVGDRYQKQDETCQFRFVIEERSAANVQFLV